MTWRATNIGEYVDSGRASIQTGPFGTQLKASDYVAEGVPVINVRNIGYGCLRENDLEFVTDTTSERLSAHILDHGDIVFGRKGAVDRHLLVQNGHAGWMQGSDCIRLRFLTPEIEPRFVSYCFLSPSHQQWILTQSSNKATMASLNQDIIKRIPIRIPSPHTQRELVKILSAYDDLLENNARRIRLLEESARLLYEEWFVRLRFPGHEHTPIHDGLPKGWQKKPLVELADMVMGQSPPSRLYNEDGEGLPFHQGVSDFGDRFVTHRIFTTSMKRIAEAGDILCSVRAPVGRLNIAPDKLVIGRGLAALRSRTGYQSLLYYQLKNHFFKEDLIGGGAIFASVSKKVLQEQELLMPTAKLAREFEDFSRPVDEQIRLLWLQNHKLQQARDLLLPRLMNGEIAV